MPWLVAVAFFSVHHIFHFQVNMEIQLAMIVVATVNTAIQQGGNSNIAAMASKFPEPSHMDFLEEQYHNVVVKMHYPSGAKHDFKMPYQLRAPQFLKHTDTPNDAHVYSVPIKVGNIIVMGSDGLFENLWIEDLGTLVNERLVLGFHMKGKREAHALAEKITEQAYSNANNREVRDLWAVEAGSRDEVGCHQLTPFLQ